MAQMHRLGMNAAIYFGAAVNFDEEETIDVATLTEMGNVRDVSVGMETSEADVTTRDNDGWRATVATLRECTVEFEMIDRPADAGFAAVKTAFLTAGEIALAILNAGRDTTGAAGPVGNFTVTNFSRSEPLEEAIKYSVTCKLSHIQEWLEVA